MILARWLYLEILRLVVDTDFVALGHNNNAWNVVSTISYI